MARCVYPWIALAALVMSHGQTLAKEKDRTLTLRFVPQESTGASSPALPGEILSRPIAILFEDSRALSDRSVIGEGTGDDDELFTWRADVDVGQFARTVFLETAAAWGVRIEPDADLRLTVRLVRLHVSERDQAVGSTYYAEARSSFVLGGADGRTLAEGAGKGDARRYGKPRSGQNCTEVLSDALKESYADLLQDESLQSRWSGRQAAGGERERHLTPDELLAELLDLKERGFSSELMVDYVSTRSVRPALGAGDLVRWKDAGIPEEVIRAALSRGAAS